LDLNEQMAFFEKVSFKEFENRKIFVRQKTLFSTIYIIGKSGTKIDEFDYGIEYYDYTKKLIITRRSENFDEIVDLKQIKRLLDKFNDYNLFFLSVKKDTLLINATYNNMEPHLLKIKNLNTKEKIKTHGNTFYYFKNGWYKRSD